jgi:hypothetical protein
MPAKNQTPTIQKKKIEIADNENAIAPNTAIIPNATPTINKQAAGKILPSPAIRENGEGQ